MRKPEINRNSQLILNENRRVSQSRFTQIGDILNKLEPQQIVDLANSLTNLAHSYFEYTRECEKTKQVKIHAGVERKKINERLTIAKLEHKQVMAQIKAQQKENKRQFKKDMKNIDGTVFELENRDKTIHRILDLLEDEKISEDTLVNIIQSLN